MSEVIEASGPAVPMSTREVMDAVVIGGGVAGLSGALMLARSRRAVVVVDGGSPRNAPADGVQGLLGREGIGPLDLAARGREEIEGYGARVVTGDVVRVEQIHGPYPEFAVHLSGGDFLRARRVLVATGLVDELPQVEGLQERWARDVIHCPYCHGWEVRDRRIAVLATHVGSQHHALLFRQLSDDVTYLVNGSELSAELRESFDARGIKVVDGIVDRLDMVDDAIAGVVLADGQHVECEVVTVATRMIARADFLAEVGLAPVALDNGVGEHVPTIDQFGRTKVSGIWVAGNVTDVSALVGAAGAAGATAGVHLNAELAGEDLQIAVAARSAAR